MYKMSHILRANSDHLFPQNVNIVYNITETKFGEVESHATFVKSALFQVTVICVNCTLMI